MPPLFDFAEAGCAAWQQLGSSEPGPQGPLRAIVRDSRGRFYAAYGSGYGAQDFVHAPDGRVLRTIGRKGNGPGEFQSVGALIIGPADTLHAFDAIARRWSVFSPEGEYVRSAPLPAVPHSAYALGNGDILINGTVRTAESIGLPLHILSSDGAVRLSFGREQAVRRPDLSLLDLREIATPHDGRFWVLHMNEYRLEEWSLDGRLLRAYERNPAWFRPWLSMSRMSPEVPPSPYPVGFVAVTAAHAWVITRVPAKDWSRGLRKTRSESGREVFVPADLPAVYDSMLEYLDLRSGRVVARAQTPLALGGFVDDDHLVAFSFDEDGRTFVSVWQVQLSTR